ncbi:hypothetical protein FGO68_gene303 [Halteria grandinella]|uniref:Uncharacterized protein n=1 Tax=Halteria grandinella TaxID=5974 RepID=A0A8J8NRU1_HALGN|nr:hypothetical protein FGO68_gene303 [Halteria grandinella]
MQIVTEVIQEYITLKRDTYRKLLRDQSKMPEVDPFEIIQIEDLIGKHNKSVGGGVDKIKVICAITYDLLTCRLVLSLIDESFANQDHYFSDLVFDTCFKNFQSAVALKERLKGASLIHNIPLICQLEEKQQLEQEKIVPNFQILGDFGGLGDAKEEAKVEQQNLVFNQYLTPTVEFAKDFIILLINNSCKNFEQLADARKTLSLKKALNNFLSNSAISKLKKWPKDASPDDRCLQILQRLSLKEKTGPNQEQLIILDATIGSLQKLNILKVNGPSVESYPQIVKSLVDGGKLEQIIQQTVDKEQTLINSKVEALLLRPVQPP